MQQNIEGPPIISETNTQGIELRLISPWGGLDGQSIVLQEIVDKFTTEHRDIKVINESTGGEDFLVNIKTEFALGNDPDVFGIYPGSDMKNLIQAGKVADLTNILTEDAEWFKSFKPESWIQNTVDGRIYGLPLEIIYEALFINSDIFESNGVEPPKTYEDLKILCYLFSSKGIIPIAYNYEAEGTYLYQNIVTQLGGRGGCIQFGDCYKRGLLTLIEINDRRGFPENAYNLSNEDRDELFLSGKAAMIVQGSWFVKDIYLSGMGDKVDIIPFPSFDNDHDYSLVYGLGGGNFFMSQKANENKEKREASIKLLKTLTSQEASRLFCKDSGFITNIKINESVYASNRLNRQGLKLIENASELVPPPDSIVDRALWEEEIVPKIPSIYDEDGMQKVELIWELINANKETIR